MPTSGAVQAAATGMRPEKSVARSAPMRCMPMYQHTKPTTVRERRDALVSALEEHFPGTEVSGIAAGLHVIAALPGRYGPRDRFLERAAAARVAVRALAHYREAVEEGGGAAEDGVRLVLGYAHLSPARIHEGVRLMGDAVRG
ncbi:hypothetical protein C4B68_35115 [Streptomyces dengpaensis]|uniref:Uncharacterized protein n=1 Tax=Streptomyces dengpaensis TaxID=2049881 RepID=A0ABM6SZL6_9ACTN|nr:hypothetical protein C4B68_35115 [Streptomyces dengpaensis]